MPAAPRLVHAKNLAKPEPGPDTRHRAPNVNGTASHGGRDGAPLRRDHDAADTALMACTKATIAMVRGYCCGGACELAVCCELRMVAGDRHSKSVAKMPRRRVTRFSVSLIRLARRFAAESCDAAIRSSTA